MAKIKTYHGDEVMGVVRHNSGLLFVHFSSPLASSCEYVHDELEQLAPSLSDLIEIAEVEVPLQELEVIRTYGIEQIPTLLLFKGDEVVERVEQVLSADDLQVFLDDAVSYYVPPAGYDEDTPQEPN